MSIFFNHIRWILASCFLLALCAAKGQTAAGDIAFIGFNSDNPDQFSIICTEYLEDGTVIYFTDAGWDGTGFYANEGHISWTVPAGGLPTNTIVTFTAGGSGQFTSFPTGTLDPGSTVSDGIIASASANPMAFSASGDQILAYTGSIAVPNFIACINFNSSWTGGTNSNTTILPAGLTDGTDAALLGNHDNGEIDCSLLPDPADVSDYNNVSNWVFNDATRYALPPAALPCALLLPIELVQFTGGPEGNAIILQWITASEYENAAFRLEKSNSGLDFHPLTVIESYGNSTATHIYTYTDDAPLSPETYYRLVQIDIYGQEQIAGVIRVAVESAEHLFVYPNPADDLLFLSNTYACVQIFDMQGKAQGTWFHAQSIPVAELAPGMYTMQCSDGNKRDAVLFIKQ